MGKIRSFWHAVGILCRAEGYLSRRTANPLGFGGATRHCDVEASNCLLVDGSNGMAPRILWPDWRSPVRRNWNPASSVCPIRRGHR